MAEDDDDNPWWEEEKVKAACELLRANDPSIQTVTITQPDEYAELILTSLRHNTVVDELHFDYRKMPLSLHVALNEYVATSPSLKGLEFYTLNASESLSSPKYIERLQLVNLLLFATTCGQRIETLQSVPLCQSTAPSLGNALRFHENLSHVTIDFPSEPTTDVHAMGNLVVDSLAPHVAQALRTTNLHSLTLNWLEEEAFPIGEGFLAALAGCLPPSLRQLELSNFEDSETISQTIANMIEQSADELDEIRLNHCKFSDASFDIILNALQQSKPNVKALNYGFLNTNTAPAFAHSIGATFRNLEELGVEFYKGNDSIEAFEVFCEHLVLNTMIKTLNIHFTYNVISTGAKAGRFLRALAIAISKLPNLCSISTLWIYHNVPSLDDRPSEFLSALQEHENLVEISRYLDFYQDQQLVDYYLKRNRFRDRLAAKKAIMVEAFQALDDDDPNSLSLVKDTLASRDDWLRAGVDQGKPMPDDALGH